MRHILALLFALVAVPAPIGDARADEFTLFVYETPVELARRTGPQQDSGDYWGAYAAFGDALQRAGAMRGGAALDVAAGSAERVGAASTPGELRLGGYFVIDVPDLAAARAWAAKVPALGAGGAVEVRRTVPNAAMMR